MPHSPIADVLAGAACVTVLLVAFLFVIRPGQFVKFGFVASTIGLLLLIASPTPPGYDPHAEPARWGGAAMTRYGSRLGGVLLAASVASLVAAAGVRRTVPKEPGAWE
jgi:hypothetical protein